MDGKLIEEKMEEAFEGWKSVHDLERMSLRDVYECAFFHGVEVAEDLLKVTPNARSEAAALAQVASTEELGRDCPRRTENEYERRI